MDPLQPIEIDVLLQRPVLVNLRAEDDTVETVSLPRLGTDGLLPWLDEITAERQTDFRKTYASLKLDARQLADAEFSANRIRAVLRDLTEPAQTPKGIRRVIGMSLSLPGASIQKLDADGKPVGAKNAIDPARQKEIEDILVFGPYSQIFAERLGSLFITNEQRLRPAADPKTKALEEAAKAFPGAKVADPLPGGDESGPNTPAPESVTTG